MSGETELPPYPPIDPTTYDLIVVGTGLPESVVAAAASHSGKSVLHLDPNPFYGSHFSSLSLPDLCSFLQQNPNSTPPCLAGSSSDFSLVNLMSRSFYSDVEISSHAEISDQESRKFCLDVSGPRALFCADKAIDLIIKSDASQYLEFKGIDASFVGDANGGLSNVPDSREAIFKNTTLGLAEKFRLNKFLQLVQQHLCGEERILDEDLESPFVDFLTKKQLPQRVLWIILHAVAMVNYDQENREDTEELLKTRDGIDQLALYISSFGRFQNASGAMIYPFYGQGELPQAFCRRAAVKGCIHVLRMPVVGLLLDKYSGLCKGVRLSSGQEIFSDKLILDPSFTVQLALATSLPVPLQETLQGLAPSEAKRKVARAICITSRSLKPDLANLLLVYPPKSLYPEQVAAVRFLQIGANLSVCPSGMFLWYLLAPCKDANEGKKLLNAAINALKLHIGEQPPSRSGDNEDLNEERPVLLWSALYVQELTQGQVGNISSMPMPDESLNYSGLLDMAVKVFQNYFPNEEFFPKTTSPENSEDDAGLTLET